MLVLTIVMLVNSLVQTILMIVALRTQKED